MDLEYVVSIIINTLFVWPYARQRALGDLRSGRAFETGCDCILATAHVLAGSNTPVCSCSVSDAMFVPVPQALYIIVYTIHVTCTVHCFVCT